MTTDLKCCVYNGNICPVLQMASSVLSSQEDEEDVESYNSGEHSGYLINNMEQFRVDSGFTDITIEVEGQRFACHKVILAAGSPYFRLETTNSLQ